MVRRSLHGALRNLEALAHFIISMGAWFQGLEVTNTPQLLLNISAHLQITQRMAIAMYTTQFVAHGSLLCLEVLL